MMYYDIMAQDKERIDDDLFFQESILKAINAPDNFDLPSSAPVIAMWVCRYRPVFPPRQGRDNVTSREIADALADTAMVTIDEVTAVMKFCGCLLCTDGPTPSWSVELRAESAD